MPSDATIFVTVVPPSPATTGPAASPDGSSLTTYSWKGSNTLYYGYCDPFCTTVGSFQESWVANLNGRQVQLTQHSTVLTGPELAVTENWQCWNSITGVLCNSYPNDVNWAFGYTSGTVGYSFSPSNADTYSYLPSANGTFHITFNWNWAALGYPNPNTFNGRYNAPPLLSPPIYCGSGNTPTCHFT